MGAASNGARTALASFALALLRAVFRRPRPLTEAGGKYGLGASSSSAEPATPNGSLSDGGPEGEMDEPYSPITFS